MVRSFSGGLQCINHILLVFSDSISSMTNYPVTPRIGGATHGDLAKQGVVAIVHAPTGAMSECGGIYEPTPESVAASIDNGFLLLLANGFNRMAVRFIGGNIFLERIGTTKETLAETIRGISKFKRDFVRCEH